MADRKSQIFDLIKKGKSYAEICEILNCTPSAISYYKKKYRTEFPEYIRSEKYDWKEVQTHYHNNGWRPTLKHFGMSSKTLYDAIQRGDVKRSFIKHNVVPLEDILNNKRACSSSKLKKKLIEASLLELKCSAESCLLTDTWNNKPLHLHLDHIDGNRQNNNLDNLRLLCPNCHSQTDTYCGKNIKARSRALPCAVSQQLDEEIYYEKVCPVCGNTFSTKRRNTCSKTCASTLNHVTKQNWDDIDLLNLYMKFNGNLCAISRHLGNVTDNAVRKQLKKRHII